MIGRQHLEVEMENEPTADIDPLESEEWIDAINSVLETEGVPRAQYLSASGPMQKKSRGKMSRPVS